MRKLYLVLASTALVAFMGFSATAFAVPDPSCDGNPYNNDPVIHDFVMTMTDSNVEGAVSGLSGKGLACGSDSADLGSLNDNADILTGPGVVVNNTSGMANGRFVGDVLINIALNVGIFGNTVVEDVQSVLLIEPLSSCQNEPLVGGQIPGEVIACYKGVNPQGFNYNIVTVGDDGRTWLTLGPFHPLLGTAGLTDIKEFNLCGRVGSSGGTTFPDDCGDSSQPFLQKNGDSSGRGSPEGNGDYTVTATNRSGQTTDPVTSHVDWICVIDQPDPDLEPPYSLSSGSARGSEEYTANQNAKLYQLAPELCRLRL